MFVDVKVEELPELEIKKEKKKFMWAKSAKNSTIEGSIEESHSKCKFCKTHFDNLPKQEIVKLKVNMIKGKIPLPPIDKEEEYFKMSLISYQMGNKVDNRVLTLDFKTLFNKAKRDNVPFFKYNKWLQTRIETL